MADKPALNTDPLQLEQRLIDHVAVEVEVMLGEVRLTVAELNRLIAADEEASSLLKQAVRHVKES